MDHHRDLAGLDLHDVFRYVAAADPGAVGAGANWLDTSLSPVLTWRRRNDANSGWLVVTGGQGDTPITVADTASVDLTLAGLNLTAALVFGTAAGTVAAGNPAHIVPTPLPTLTLVDDFWSGTAESGEVGSHGWATVLAPTFPAAEAGHPGIARLSTAATIGSLNAAFPAQEVFPASTFDVAFVVRTPASAVAANATLRFGLMSSATSLATTHGIYFEKAAGGTALVGVTRASSAQTATVTLATLAAATWYRFRLRRVNASTVGFSVNGGAETTATLTIPTAFLSPAAFVYTADAVVREIDLDFVSVVVTGLAR